MNFHYNNGIHSKALLITGTVGELNIITEPITEIQKCNFTAIHCAVHLSIAKTSVKVPSRVQIFTKFSALTDNNLIGFCRVVTS